MSLATSVVQLTPCMHSPAYIQCPIMIRDQCKILHHIDRKIFVIQLNYTHFHAQHTLVMHVVQV